MEGVAAAYTIQRNISSTVMKYTLGIIFFFCIKSYAQTKAGLRVQYTMFCNTDLPLKYKTILWIQDNESIYKEEFSTTERWEEKPTEASTFNIERLRNNEGTYLRVDNKNKTLQFFDKLSGHIILVTDTYNSFKWDVTNDTKVIAGYKCNKATTSFRGREWIAWFTPEIPVSFGPWKLHGLPGLILECYDVTQRYRISAEGIKTETSALFSKDFKTLMVSKNKVAMPYREFLEKQEEARNNRLSSLANVPGLQIDKAEKPPRNGIELKYEWEK